MILDEARKAAKQQVALRRALHRHPELAFAEEQTAKILMSELNTIGLPYDYQGKGSAVVASLHAGHDAPVIALRADMDALPGEEHTGLPFSSVHEGRVHACGHDAHMAMVMGAARLLHQLPLPVNVRFIFQPAEENGGGARTVVAAGHLDDVDAIFGGHVTHHYAVGEIMVAEGVITAQSDRFRIDIQGRGGHGARPHEAIDAVVIAASLVNSLQTLVSREINPLHPSVLTIGTLHAGSAPNVIADTAVLEGSIRSTLPAVRDHIHAGIERMANAYAALHNAKLTVQLTSGYPPVVNTPGETQLALRAARTVVGDKGLVQMDYPSMGAEDFAYYLEKVPGCYVRLGARPQGVDYIPLHSPAFDIDEDVLPVGAAFFYETVHEAALAFG